MKWAGGVRAAAIEVLLATAWMVVVGSGSPWVVVVLEEVHDEDEEAESVHVLRIALTREQAAAFAIHATRLVEAGRPPCPLCGLPLDPSGHACPRTNGHRPPVT